MFSDVRLARCIRRRIGGGPLTETTPIVRWKMRRHNSFAGTRGVSARELAASLWRFAEIGNGGSVTWRFSLFDRRGFECCSSIPKVAIEEVTKWNNCYSKALHEFSVFSSHVNPNITKKMASTEQAAMIKPESEFTKKAGQNKKFKEGIPMIAENQKMRSILKSLVNDLEKERRKCKKMDFNNSKLLADVAKTKSSASKCNQNLGNQRKARELLENVCSELAKAVGDGKAEIMALRNQSMRIKEELEKERKMQQMTKVLREEHTQMKLVDAKVILEDKYMKINGLIADFEATLRPSDSKNSGQAVDPTVRKKSSSSNGSSTVGDSSHKDSLEGSVNKLRMSNHMSKCDPSCSRSRISQSSESISVSSSHQSKKISKRHTTAKEESGMLSNGLVSPTISFSLAQRVPGETVINNSHNPVSRLLRSAEPRNPHVVRPMKGHNVWPQAVQRHGSGANLLEAKLEGQKMLIRNLLKHER